MQPLSILARTKHGGIMQFNLVTIAIILVVVFILIKGFNWTTAFGFD